MIKKIVNESASNLWIYHHLTNIYNSAFFIVVLTEKPDLKNERIIEWKFKWNKELSYIVFYWINSSVKLNDDNWTSRGSQWLGILCSVGYHMCFSLRFDQHQLLHLYIDNEYRIKSFHIDTFYQSNMIPLRCR